MITFEEDKLMDRYPYQDFSKKYVEFCRGYGSEDIMSDFETK